MWAALIPLFSSLLGENGPLGQFFKTKAQQVQAQADLQLQIEKDKLSLSLALAQAAVESEKNKLAATSQTFKAVSFFLLNIPIIITCVSKVRGADLWFNLTAVPVWYAQLYVSVVFVIWGLPVVANATGTIFSAIQEAWELRNQGKIQKIQALGEATALNLEQAKKQIFDIMRRTTGTLSQPQVDAANPVIDQAFQLAQQALQNKAQATAPVTVNTGDSMIVQPEDLSALIRAGLLGLISLAFYLIKGMYTEFRRLQKDVLEGYHGDKVLAFKIETIAAKLDDLQDIVTGHYRSHHKSHADKTKYSNGLDDDEKGNH